MVKALLAAPWVDTRPDEDRLGEFLTFGYAMSPATMWRGVLQVPAASYVVFDGREAHGPMPYWSALPEPGEPSPSDALEPSDVAQLVRDVRRRMISDVPLGALLSGGIDSSVVVGLISEASEEPVHTFSIGFPDEASYDERRYAQVVADHFGTRHTEFAVKVDAVGLLDRLIWHHDGPFADDSAVPTYLVSELAREAVTVVLNGDGGDEVFGGYARFSAAALAQAIPAPAARLARAARRALPRGHGYYDLRTRLDRFVAAPGEPLERRYLDWISVFAEDVVADLLERPPARPAGAFTAKIEEAGHLPPRRRSWPGSPESPRAWVSG